MRQRFIYLMLLILGMTVLVSCRNETQNQIRRSIQDFTATKMYITLYSLDGSVVFEGDVDGKVTRSTASSDNGSSNSQGEYVYWYDQQGRYHQTDMPYLLTTYDRTSQ